MKTMSYVRKELEGRRRQEGITQRQQAERIGWTENEFSRWLRSRRPTLEKLEKVATLLDLDLPALLAQVNQSA